MGSPFIKWAGGKGRQLSQLSPLLPFGFERMRYHEPFLGGGAMFFAFAPCREAWLSDVNADLITTYRAVRDTVDDVAFHLQTLAEAHKERPKAHYYEVRDRFNAVVTSGSYRAAMFIYLNRTCFNGLYRVNKAGSFNVPFGDYPNPTICDKRALRAASKALQGAQLNAASFEDTLDSVGEGDFVYLDPPYVPTSATSFTGYAKGGFGMMHQRMLRDVFFEMHGRGARLMLSQSDTPLVREMYGDMNVVRVSAKRSINSKANGRGAVGELVVCNYVPSAKELAV